MMWRPQGHRATKERVIESTPWKGRAGESQIILELQVVLITEPPKANVPEPSIIGSPESPPWGTSDFQDLNPSVARTQLFKKESIFFF